MRAWTAGGLTRAAPVCALALLCPLVLGSDCGGGDGSSGRPAVVQIESPDPRCVALPDAFGFPPGYDFVPGVPGRLLAATFAERVLVPLDVNQTPFTVPEDAEPYTFPDDVDADGCPELAPPLIDDVFVPGRDLAMITASLYESVLTVHPDGDAREIVLAMPPAPPPDFDRTQSIDPAEYLFWPEPGTSEVRTGVPNLHCIVAPEGAVDSRGDRVGSARPSGQICPRPRQRICPQDRPSYGAGFTSGAALAAGRLFVSVSNVGADRGTARTQYLPGAVTVFEWDASGARPRVTPIATPDGGAFLLTREGHYNATHVQTHVTPGGRELLLVTLTGAIGIIEDDPSTGEVESGTRRITDGAIDVFDPVALQLVATYPLRGANPAFNGVAVDPTGQLAVLGDVTARSVYAVDLTPLDALVDPPRPGDPPLVLDGRFVVFDGENPFRIPAIEDGAPFETCPGRIDSVAWNDAGTNFYALDVCDGSLTGVRVDLSTGPDPSGFFLGPTVPLTAPLHPDSLGLPRTPSKLKVRPGRPGVDFEGPDVFFLVSEEEALICGVAIESDS